MNFPPGPTAESAVLGYAAPLIARMTLKRDGLRGGVRPMAYRTALLSPITVGHTDALALNDGAEPSQFGGGMANTITQAIGHARSWAIAQLTEARSLTAEEAETLLEAHVTWNVIALMSDEEVEVLNDLGDDGQSSRSGNDD